MKAVVWWVVAGSLVSVAQWGYDMFLSPNIARLGDLGGEPVGGIVLAFTWLAKAWVALVVVALVNGFFGGKFKVRLTSPGEGL